MPPPTQGRPLAVLMGDIVGSEAVVSADLLHRRFNDAVDGANIRHEVGLASPLTITLGDEFQGVVMDLQRAAVIARDIRLTLMAHHIDCRFVIGRIALKTPLNPDQAWNMMGSGLARARERLEEKARENYYRFSLPDRPVEETLLEAVGAGLTSLEKRWTDKQLRNISDTLSGLSANDIAKQRNVRAHSVYKVRSAGAFDLYMMQWDALREALGTLDREAALP